MPARHSRITRRVLVAAASLAVTATLLAPAEAGEVASAVRVTPPVGAPTSRIVVSGSGFLASELVAIRFDATLVRRIRADDTGAFRTRARVPRAARPGDHRILAVGIESEALATAPFAVHTNWPQFMRTKRRAGFNPLENVISTDNVASLSVKWRGALAGRIFMQSPVAVDGVVYMASGDAFDTGAIEAFDLNCGSGGGTCEPLSTCCANQWLFTAPVVEGLAFDGRQVTVYAYDVEDCSDGFCDPVWTGDAGNYVATSPVVSDGRLFVGLCGFCEGLESDPMIRAFDAATGAILWSAPGRDASYSAPAVRDGVVYIGDDIGNVYAFDAEDGTLQWRAGTGCCSVNTPPLIVGDLVVVSAGVGLFAFDADGCGAQECDPVWLSADHLGDSHGLAAGQGSVFVSVSSGGVFAFDARGCGVARCAPVWSWHLPTNIDSAPAVAGDVLYATGSDDHLYAFDARGCGTQQCPPIADIPDVGSGSPIVVDGTVIVPDNEGLTALAPVEP